MTVPSAISPFKAAANSGKSDPPTRPFSIRLTDDERKRLRELAGDVPLGVYIRRVLFGRNESKRKANLARIQSDQRLVQVLGKLGETRLAANMNQIAKAANLGTLDVGEDTEKQLQDACRALIAMRNALIVALRMRPRA